jgi:hypothetical protein
VSEPDIDLIRAMRKMFENGISRHATAEYTKLSFTTVDRYYNQFKIDRRASLNGDIPELNFLPREIFHQYAAEAKRRKMTNRELIKSVLTIVAKVDKRSGDNLFAAVLDFKQDEKK